MELKFQVSISEPGYARCLFIQFCSLDNRIVRPSGEFDYDAVSPHQDICFHVDELTEDGRGPAIFESPEFLRQQMVQCMSDHGHQNIEVHLDQDG